jgi:hypothetical protein
VPRFAQAFETSCEETLRIVADTETLWVAAPPTSVIRKQLKARQIEALYEACYLRIFAAWENFLEASTIYFMAGKGTPGYRPIPASGEVLYRTQRAARAALYGNSHYLLWHGADKVSLRVSKWLNACPVELVVNTNRTNLEDFAAIRHSIAHASEDSKSSFRDASLRLTGVDLRNAGHLLRADNHADPLNRPRWIRVIVDELEDLARAIQS